MVSKPPAVGNGPRQRKKSGPGVIKIRWDSHSSTISGHFYRMLQREQLVDIVLACEGKMIKCHRLVLSACSPYFEDVLNDLKCLPSGEMVFFVAGMSFWELKALVMFMYTGEISISKDHAVNFIQAAAELQVRGLNNVNPYTLTSVSPSALTPASQPPPSSAKQYQPIPLPRKYTMPNIKQEVLDDDDPVPPSPKKKENSKTQNSPTEPLTLVKIKEEPKDYDDDDCADHQASSAETVLPNPAYDGGEGVLSLESVKTEVMDVDEDADICPSGHKREQREGTGNKKSNHGASLDETDPEKEQDESVADAEQDESNAALDDDSEYENVPTKKTRHRRTKYPAELRQASVNDLIHKGISLSEVADKYCVPKKTLSNWKSKYFKDLNALNHKSVDVHKRKSALAMQPEATAKTASKKQSASGLSLISSLPPIEGKTREERLQHAAKLVVDKMTNVRGAAAHYGIPRTTLSNYMRRNGLIHLRRGSTSPEPGDRCYDELPELSDNGDLEPPNDLFDETIETGPCQSIIMAESDEVDPAGGEFASRNNDSSAMEA